MKKEIQRKSSRVEIVDSSYKLLRRILWTPAETTIYSFICLLKWLITLLHYTCIYVLIPPLQCVIKTQVSTTIYFFIPIKWLINKMLVILFGLGSIIIFGIMFMVKRRNGENAGSLQIPRVFNQSHKSEGINNFETEHFKSIKTENNLTIKTTSHLVETYSDRVNKMRRVEVGKGSGSEKVILLVGATGSGKTTLINAMFNHIMGVKWEDNFRFKLIDETSTGQNQAQSQTEWITAYTIHHQPWFKVPYTLTIIDTPGFGDTRGIQRDEEIKKQIETLFTNKGDNGVDHLDAIGFVSFASLSRLTPTQHYIFHSVLSLFGKDLKDNIFMMLTHHDSDPEVEPQAVSVIKAADVEYKACFKFNNSALYADNQSDKDKWKNLFWKLGTDSCDAFMKELRNFCPKSLQLTEKYLRKRKRVENVTEGICVKVGMELRKWEVFQKDHQILQRHKDDIDTRVGFTEEAKELVQEEKNTDEHAMSCRKCKITCHSLCSFSKDEPKKECSVMHRERCEVCSCLLEDHKHARSMYVANVRNVDKSIVELRQEYGNGSRKKLNAKQLIKNCAKRMESVDEAILSAVKQTQDHIEILNEMALKPNVSEALDLFIERETSVANDGWKERVEYFKGIKMKIRPWWQRFIDAMKWLCCRCFGCGIKHD